MVSKIVPYADTKGGYRIMDEKGENMPARHKRSCIADSYAGSFVSGVHVTYSSARLMLVSPSTMKTMRSQILPLWSATRSSLCAIQSR